MLLLGVSEIVVGGRRRGSRIGSIPTEVNPPFPDGKPGSTVAGDAGTNDRAGHLASPARMHGGEPAANTRLAHWCYSVLHG